LLTKSSNNRKKLEIAALRRCRLLAPLPHRRGMSLTGRETDMDDGAGNNVRGHRVGFDSPRASLTTSPAPETMPVKGEILILH
jgi:hypothetical protein